MSIKRVFEEHKSSWDFRHGKAFMSLCDSLGTPKAQDICWAVSGTDDYRVSTKWLEWYAEVLK